MSPNYKDSEILVCHDAFSDSIDFNDYKQEIIWKRKYMLSFLLMFGFVSFLSAGVLGFYYLEVSLLFSRHAILQSKVIQPVCTKVSDLDKLDCYPDAQGAVTEKQCESRGCCYHAVESRNRNDGSSFPPLGIPYCYYPLDYVGYALKNITFDKNTYCAILERVTPSGFPKDISSLTLLISELSENTVEIKIKDPNHERFEVPVIKPPTSKQKYNGESLYSVNLTDSGLLTIIRKSSGVTIFSTDLSRLVFADQFLQLSTNLPSSNIYGLGEHYDHLQRNINWTRTTLFNRDLAPVPDMNLYGTHPFYLALEKDRNSNGVFFLNSNSMDFILQPTPALTFRSIGGILDLFVFLGPSAKDVVRQYTNIVGRPFMPPYWSLGFHLCKYGYKSLNETKKVWQRTRDAKIPFDVQWNDIDYMNNHNDFTYDKINFDGLDNFVDNLHEAGMHYVVIVDPGISNVEKPGTYPPYDDGIKYDVFVKNSSGDIFIGKVWNEVSTVFPDFSHPAASSYWAQQFKNFHDLIKIDGAWIDMNEPSNFLSFYGCPSDSPLENPPYVPGGHEPISTKTICVSAKHYYTTHYNEHNLYAYREAVATNLAMRNITGKRPFVISRASYSGQGHYSGHWSGDIKSSWEDMRYSVVDLLNFNIFGIPMMGSDICGFGGNTTVDLCARWSSLGAFYPFSRNHNDLNSIPQDPVALGPVVVAAARNALRIRYQILPYLYTLFYKSHVYGDTVARPLFFEFSSDPNTYSIDEQFLLGPAFMVMPVLYPDMKSVTAYFPKGLWYDFLSAKVYNSSGENITLAAPLDAINLAVRGGYILPLQISNATTTTESRLSNFSVYAALNENSEAKGELYWDDGESLDSVEAKVYNLIEFTLKNNTLTTTVIHDGYKMPMKADFCKICSLASNPKEVTVNGKPASYEFNNKCLYIFVGGLSLLQANTINWM